MHSCRFYATCKREDSL